MARPSTRRTMTLESLEKREVLSAPAPDATSQYALELLNLARTNPPAAAQWIVNHADADVQATLNYYGVNLQTAVNEIAAATPQPPLAWNGTLASAALGHSQDMAQNNFQSHTGSDGSTPQTRMQAAGYSNSSSSGENAFAYATSVDEAMEAFLVDWGVADQGHRKNILQPGVSAQDSYKDVGIGLVNTGNDPSASVVGPLVETMDFGAQSSEQAQLLGVVYDDPTGGTLYAPGEGVGGATIQATNLATGQTSWTVSSNAGGYQFPLAPGNYFVTAQVGGKVVGGTTVNVGSVNVKADFNTGVAYNGPTTAPVASTPTPAAAPTPTPTPAPAPARQLAASTPAVNYWNMVTNWSAYQNGVRIGG